MSVNHLIFTRAADVGRADVTSMVPDLDTAPAAAALADAAHDALLGIVSDFGRVIWADANRARGSRFDDRGAAIGEHRDEHPALGSVGVLDEAPRFVFLDHANRKVAPLVEPDVRV